MTVKTDVEKIRDFWANFEWPIDPTSAKATKKSPICGMETLTRAVYLGHLGIKGMW